MSSCGDDETKSIQKGESFKTLQMLELTKSPLTFRYLSRQIEAFNPRSAKGISMYRIEGTMFN